MKKIVSLTIFLAVVCACCSAVLFFTNQLTAPVIAKHQAETTEKMLKELVPGADKFEVVDVDSKVLKKVYEVSKDGKSDISVLEIYTIGFQSELKLLVAVNGEGKYAGFKVIEQAETPGYGTKIETDKKYLKQFTSKSISDELDTIAGSTVTTEAVKKAIETALEEYKELK